MADNYGVGALGGVVLVDPDTGLPYKATGGGGGGAVDSVNGQTGTVVLDADDIGLGNVTNDAQLKASDLDTDPDLTANSDAKVPSQKAVKAYVDANSGGGGGAVDSVNGQTGTVVLDAGDVGARADNWVPTIEDVPNLENSLDTLANDISVAPYVVSWTTQDQVRPDTDRVVWWVGDLEFPPDNAIETDIVTRT